MEEFHVNWIFIACGILVLLLSVLGAVFVNRWYNPETGYTEEEQEKIPLPFYIIFCILGFSTCLKIIHTLVDAFRDSHHYSQLIDINSPHYHPLSYINNLLNFNLNMFLSVWGILCIIQFIQRRSSFPNLLAFYFIVNVVVGVTYYSIAHHLKDLDLTDTITDIFFTLAFSLPVILYILSFPRSKSVFVVMYKYSSRKLETYKRAHYIS